jgi:sorting nexin-1/2
MAMSEMGQAFKELPNESLLDSSLKQKLQVLGDIHTKISQIQAAEASISPQTTVNEYIRLMGSIKLNFLSRQKVFERMSKVEKEFKKKEQETAKVSSESKVRTDKISILKQTLEGLELELENESKYFTKITDGLIAEIERDEIQRIGEFTQVLKQFVLDMLQQQKEVIFSLTVRFKIAGKNTTLRCDVKLYKFIILHFFDFRLTLKRYFSWC